MTGSASAVPVLHQPTRGATGWGLDILSPGDTGIMSDLSVSLEALKSNQAGASDGAAGFNPSTDRGASHAGQAGAGPGHGGAGPQGLRLPLAHAPE